MVSLARRIIRDMAEAEAELSIVSLEFQSSSTYAYDPLMRLAVIDSSNAALDASLGYDGQEIILEGLSNSRTRRYVRGPGVDEPLVAYLVTPSGTSRSWYLADERGSTVRQTGDAGNPVGGLGRYDEYGVGPGTSRFQYTGQYWLGDGNLHYYRARMYDPRLGRFLQPDPIGYGDGMNLYAYVYGDPINFIDPSGLNGCGASNDEEPQVCGGGGGGGGGGRGRMGGGGKFQPNMPGEGGGGSELGYLGAATIPEEAGDATNFCGSTVFPLAGSDIFSRYGITGKPLGLPPYRLQGKTALSTIYGTNETAMTYFLFLHKSTDDYLLIPNPFVGAGLTSLPSRISYRIGATGLGRIDIPANTFTLNRPESIHVSPQCPIKK